jgi:hypothetical protein
MELSSLPARFVIIFNSISAWLIGTNFTFQASESELPGWFRFTITMGRTIVEPAVGQLVRALEKLGRKVLESEMSKASL